MKIINSIDGIYNLNNKLMDILFIATKNDLHAKIASEYLKQIFPKSEVVFGVQGEKFPED